MTGPKAPILNIMPENPGEDIASAMQDMLICGLPGRRLSNAIEFVRQAMAQAAGQCTVINVNTMSSEARHPVQCGDGPMLLWADCPDESTVQWARSGNAPILLIDAPFEEVALEFMASRKASFSDCARVLSLARIGWWQLAEAPAAAIVDCAEPLGSRLADVLEKWGVCNPAAGFAEPDGGDEAGPAMAAPPAWEGAALAGLGAFYGKRSSTQARELSIALPLLFDGAPPHLPLCGTIDLTGPVRALSFGPFLYLPQGQWRLHFQFDARLNRTGNALMFDLFVDGQSKNATEFDLRQDGRFDFECQFQVKDPWSTLEFRSHLRRGAIEGEFTPLALHIRRI